MNRRRFLAATTMAAVASSFGCAQGKTAPATPTAVASTAPTEPIDWYDVREWGLEGRAFADTESYFDRLPARAKSVVRKEVWDLSHHTAGMSVRFTADAKNIYIRYTLTKTELAMAHMPASGVSGVDLYVKDKDTWRWLGGARPRQAEFIGKLSELGRPDGKQEYVANLPLYNGVKSMEIGVSKGGSFAGIAPRKAKPILFYGTSVTQGGCASRPGMAFVSILGRRLNKPMLNFGFSGNGRMEVEVAQFLAEIDAAIFVLDCGANTPAKQLEERTPGVVKLLREKHRETPILLVQERPLEQRAVVPAVEKAHQEKMAALRNAYKVLEKEGVKNVRLLERDDFLGSDGEGTVDGSHPTDLGMLRYADALEDELRQLIKA